MKLHVIFAALVAAFPLTLNANSANAAISIVNAFGAGGWKSDDTRSTSGTNLVGINNTHAGKPGQVPSAADDAAIAAQIQFVSGPSGSTYGGAVSIDGTTASAGKSNFSVLNSIASFNLSTFSATYESYKQNLGGGSTLAFKLGIRSTDWGTGAGQSQNGFTAIRSGESEWDLVLVHVPTVASSVWSTISVDRNDGLWSLFRQAGNAFFPAPSAAKTLDDWNADAYWGSKLFDAGGGATVSSVQFGLGSSQPNGFAYVDYLQTTLLNGGDVIDFQAAVPEPGSLIVWSLLGLAIGGGNWWRRRKAVA